MMRAPQPSLAGRRLLTILGSGTSTGVPVLGCDCAVCQSDASKNHRTRCSALLSYAGQHILIDSSTDLRQQLLREKIGHIDAVLYTHPHADHLHGIDDLRVFTQQDSPAMPLYGSAATLNQIRTNFAYIFDPASEPGYIPKLETRPVRAAFEIAGQQMIPVPLLHGKMEVFGYRIGSLAYLTDCNAIPDSSWALLKGIEYLVLDGLRFAEHRTHFNIAQAIDAARRSGASRTWLTHLSHNIDHLRHEQQLPVGIKLAFDGQQIRF